MSTIDLSALGAVGDNSAMAGAKGAGEKVTGTAEVSVTETSSSASSSVTATSSSTPTVPTPHPVHTPTPHPHPAPKPMKVKPAPKAVVKKVEKEPEPVCGDVKNATCADIEKYEHCGFCLLDKNPTVGAGCTYSKQMMKKEGKKGEYEVVLVPDCECDGTFILEAKSCPTCDHALEQLLKCAGVTVHELIEIPAKCLKEVGVTVEYLVYCGYVKMEKEHDPKVVIVKKEKEASPVPHPTYKYVKPPQHVAPVPTASATSSAVASGEGASASASASASVGN